MNTRLIRYQLRESTSQYRVLILSMADEIDRLRRKEAVMLAMMQQVVQLNRREHSRNRRRAA